MATATGIDTDALKQAIEARDADAQIAMYADDAEVTLVDKMNPPSDPMRISGREGIADWVRDVTSRDMTHEVRDLVAAGNKVSFTTQCRYADGMRVTCMSTMEVANGHIVRQDGVQAWDDA